MIKKTLLFLFFIYAVHGHFLDFKFDKEVMILKEDNFVRALNQFPYVLVHFYNSETPDFKKDFSEFAKAAQELSPLYPGLKISRLNANTSKAKADMYHITAESNVRLFVKNGYEPLVYKGGQKSQELVAWLKEYLEESVKKASSLEETLEFISKNKNVVLYLGSYQDVSFTTFIGAISIFKSKDPAFLWTDDSSVKSHFGVAEGKSAVIVVRNFDEERSVSYNPTNNTQLISFINTRIFPTTMVYDKDARKRIQVDEQDAIILFKNPDAAGAKVEKIFRAVAEEFRDEIAFMIVESGDNAGRLVAGGFELEEKDYPRIGIIKASDKMRKFLMDREISSRELRAFLFHFFEDNLRQFCKSEPIPREPYDGNVRKLVARNYNRVVLDETKDVLVELYSPTCPFCKLFAPTYSKLADKLANVEDLVVAKIDAIFNEFEEVDLTGIPIIYFYPRGGKANPIKSSTERSIPALMEFLRKHATVQIPENIEL
jgi:protein disulfide isomerase